MKSSIEEADELIESLVRRRDSDKSSALESSIRSLRKWRRKLMADGDPNDPPPPGDNPPPQNPPLPPG